MVDIKRQKYRTPLPTNLADSQAWAAFLDAQELILHCTMYTVALKKVLREQAELTDIFTRMMELNDKLDGLLDRYDWAIVQANQVDPEEASVASCLKTQAQIKLNSARIKLHRFNAFMDQPLFSRKHCDLEKTTNLMSCCTRLEDSFDATNLPSPPGSDTSINYVAPEIAFVDVSAAKACMRAAMAISKAFDSLPYPSAELTSKLYSKPMLAPRTMPSFACCAMQGSYALLMLCHKSNEHAASNASRTGVAELFAGIERILAALNNYAMAFEAIGGMRGKISFTKMIMYSRNMSRSSSRRT